MESRRFLIPGAGKGAGCKGYTSKPLREVHDDTPEMRERIAEACSLRDEPEAISGHWVDAQSELAARYDLLRRMKAHEEAKVDRQKLSIANRILDVQRRSRLQRIDFGHELQIIYKMLNRGNPKGVERLERLEARLDGVLEEAA